MDGNGRWARARGLPIAQGHHEGGEAVQRCVRAAIDAQVPYLTLYAFSSENWRRSEEEIGNLTSLLQFYLRHKLEELHSLGVRLHIIGEPERFGSTLCQELQMAEARTSANTKLTLSLALSYGGRAEIARAARALARKAADGLLPPDSITEEHLASALQTSGIPDPDVVVRTSGEHRLSNFLLWQSAYAELVFLDVLWPDFSERDFSRVVSCYAMRQRRFGGRPQ
ncbi:di-trans,poly-cis-decaprenylcistransferase [Oecophyllibacter saccharovorans]|uniref:Isoprenyl transferase n=2 Tax=Oecophyllibacter saccharovorans TaxID=2558360 RepID=A0A506URY4_9PROT|nr:di-trans,poly-cis-decaprenylcistransferase [Oecophyllibacter saccharovorans]TPW36864.1 di-trans,poly-cis-decaprenylcistransferase [Oecophyllibacter saccharovorans]